MGKYREDATELLRLVGGRDNIVAVTHCMTRMRFALSYAVYREVRKQPRRNLGKGIQSDFTICRSNCTASLLVQSRHSWPFYRSIVESRTFDRRGYIISRKFVKQVL